MIFLELNSIVNANRTKYSNRFLNNGDGVYRQTNMKIIVLPFLLLAVGLTHSFAAQANVNQKKLDKTVTRALQTFNTPGMSVGIIHKGKVVSLSGYGMRNVEQQLPVTGETQFRLASTSKAFTAASVAILVDEGKLNWDDKVVDYLPDFRMMDPWVTAEFTIRDLLTHRSGLVSGAGDSMIWPEPSGFSRYEVIQNLKFLTPKYSFRSKYAYSNVFYITAAELVSKIAMMPWETFIETRIFKPLGMSCYAGDMPVIAMKNIANAYGYDDQGKTYLIPRNGIKGQALMSAAAGGIVCNAQDMLKWANYLLTLGASINDDEAEDITPSVFSARRLEDMWYPNTILAVSDRDRELDNTNFRNYGLGWRLSDVEGYRVISHTGTLSGYQAYFVLVPKLELGIVLLNNGSNSGARSAVMQTILKSYMANAVQVDWVDDYQQYREQRRLKYQTKYQEPIGSGKVLLDLTAYAGQFKDDWFGEIQIINLDGKLRVSSARMVTLKGSLEPFNDHSFVIRWDNQNAATDAFIHFDVDVSREVNSFTLHPFSVEIEDDHEYRDMNFERVTE